MTEYKEVPMIKKVGVVGAGTMGSGIAALAASAGIPLVLLDICPSSMLILPSSSAWS